MKLLISIYFFLFVMVAYAEDIRIGNSTSSDFFPYQLVVDAGVAAKAFSENKDDQIKYVFYYVAEIEELLLYGRDEDNYQLFKSNCLKHKAPKDDVFFCAKAQANDAIFEKKIEVNLESFGYQLKNISGDIKSVKTDEGLSCYLIDKQNNRYALIGKLSIDCDKQNKKVVLKGYLSPENDYSLRGSKMQVKHQFKIIEKVN